MVTLFPLDVMHQIDLGVCKLIWTQILTRKHLNPIPQTKLNELNLEFDSLRNSTPWEFSRRPISLFESKYFKATEFRQFSVNWNNLIFNFFYPINPQIFNHFMLLVYSYRI